MDEPDRQHRARILKWLDLALSWKYELGQQQHGGYLPDKGGLLFEAENEMIDQAVYLQTLREQLLRVESWIEHGATDKALIALGLILRGSTYDRFPED
jgi:hypothetical protein